MPIATPFHPRTAQHCQSLRWKDWAGYYAVCSYDTTQDREYFAFRHSAGLIDVTPLFKYEVHGPDAARFLARVMSKDVEKLKLGQVTYLCWCDDEGRLVDDGTVARLEENYFRVTAAEPSYGWLQKFSRGYRVQIEDSSQSIAVLSLQGPNARAILSQIADVEAMKFFRIQKLEALKGWVSRTGYTGDLGYEVWVPNENALKLWDALMDAGRSYGIEPAGLDAMDVTRIESGFIMNGVDYFSANHCLARSRMSTPFEVGLGWTVQLERAPFIGQKALAEEFRRGPAKKLVGLDISWVELEKHYSDLGLPPSMCSAAWRTSVPLYNDDGQQIGRASSGAWSPTLKKNLALAHLDARYADVGSKVRFEVTVEFQRKSVTAEIVPTPFYNPERKKA